MMTSHAFLDQQVRPPDDLSGLFPAEGEAMR